MKIPKVIKTYCKHCNKYTEHSVSITKTKNRSALRKGSIARAKRRGLGTGHGNLGKYGSKPPITKWKRTGSKSSKKTDLRLKCKVCGKSIIKSLKRSKKIEMK